MGCNYSKPWKKDPSNPNAVAAYQWDEKECGFGSNEFHLKEDYEEVDENFTKVKAVIEPKLPEAVDLIMEHATRGCFCDSLDFSPAVEAINGNGWAVGVNRMLDEANLGYSVDAFAWKEWHYNGQSSRQVTFLVLRISKNVEKPVEDKAIEEQ